MYTITRHYQYSPPDNFAWKWPVEFKATSRFQWLARLKAKFQALRYSSPNSCLLFQREQIEQTQTNKQKQIK